MAIEGAWIYVDPGGIEHYLSALTMNRLFESIENIGLPPIENLVTVGPQQDGATFQDFRLRPRVIPIVFVEFGETLLDLYAAHQRWLAAMKPDASTGKLKRLMPDGTKYEIDVRIASGLTMGSRERPSPVTQRYGVQFVAHDPVWRKLPQQSQIFIIENITQLTFPITFPIIFGGSLLDETTIIAVAGTWKAYPTIVLTGPLTNPKVSNESTGQLIQLNYTVPAGRIVTIDLTPGVKTVKDDLGTNLIGYISTDSDLFGFHLGVPPEVSGGNNSIRIQTSGATNDSEINLSWYPRYIGI